MRIEVLTIGGEILSGRVADSNFHFLAGRLSSFGLAPFRHTTVSDDRGDLDRALRRAWDEADGMVVTGGLGATSDDRTRPALAALLDVPLELRPELWRRLEEWFRSRGRAVPSVARRMAELPAGAEAIENPVGSAPGIWVEERGRWLCALPGVPHEMRAMVERTLLPRIIQRTGDRRQREIVLRTSGVSETSLESRLGPVPHPGFEIAFLPHFGGVDLRFLGATGSDESVFRAWVDSARGRLGDCVWGTGAETLEERIGALLLERCWRLGVAESITGGALSARLVSVPGASRYLQGGVVAYANEAKESLLGVSRSSLARHGAVSAECAGEMARGVRERFGVELGVATTGIAGPEGATAAKPLGLVYTAWAWDGGAAHVRNVYSGDRLGVIERTVAGALYGTWRRLNDLPLEAPAW